MLFFEKLPLDLRRLIALYFKFSFSFSFLLIDEYHNILGISVDDEMIWKLIFERDFGSSSQLSEVINFRKEYIDVFGKNCQDRITYAGKYSLKKLEIDSYLYQAVCGTNVENVKYLIKNGADVNVQDNHYSSTVYLTVGVQDSCRFVYPAPTINMEILIHLISCGANIDNQRFDGESALHYVSESHNVEMVKYLIEKGANINIQNKYGSTPLSRAIFYNMMKIVECLIEYGADVNFQNKNGKTPLYIAIECGRLEIISYLIKKGADPNVIFKHRNLYSFLSKEKLFII